jgi:hypothetical protein
MGTGSFPGVKWPGREASHPTPSSAEANERVELYLYSPLGLIACMRAPLRSFPPENKWEADSSARAV